MTKQFIQFLINIYLNLQNFSVSIMSKIINKDNIFIQIFFELFIEPVLIYIKREGIFKVLRLVLTIYFLSFFPLILIYSFLTNIVLFGFFMILFLFIYIHHGDDYRVQLFFSFYILILILIKMFL